ncbi:hypothetical protein [Citricoccus muralis]|uniref:Uncharacterized protein n=1 Tax=Citricoccus muralis TaxID=169134 RepID=A0ABY8H3P3_9MICC|nr:hypothetical protein [Citricoccus muralis]WFP15756.1 hypothetical protein P8192_10150 [Citricoccus muralis]
MSLRDLEQIQHDVVEPRSRALLAEVVKCYEGGAHRAALVSLWIAVVADLTSKIRYLAESGDGQAAEVVDGLDRALANQTVSRVQEYERNILDTAEKRLGILLPRERVELERLNEDRNLCAHPGYIDDGEVFMPDAEVVRTHLVAANRAVFAQRPLAGKRILTTLENEVKSESWPNDDEYFLARFFQPARETVKVNLVKVLIKNSLRPPDRSNRVAKRSRESVYAIAAEAPALFEECLRSVLHTWETSASLGDEELVRAVGAYGSRSIFWSVFPGTGRSRLMALLDHCELGMLLDERFFVCGAPVDPIVAIRFKQIVDELDAEQLSRAVRQSMDHRAFVRPAIERVRLSASFRGAEANLRLVEKCSADLTPEDVALLREAIETNARDQVRLAGYTEAILSSIYSGCPTSVEARDEWSALAEWLHEQGVENDDEYYLYDAFNELVSANE